MRRTVVVSTIAALFAAGPLLAQAGRITGTVTSTDGARPLAGATVAMVGSGARAVTGPDGRYTLAVPVGSHQLTATVVGHASATRAVTVGAQSPAVVDFQLAPAAIALDALVAIGYGERRVRDVTGVVASVSDEEFNTGRVVSPEQLIQGKVAGVQVIDSGEPGGTVNVRLRGGTSVTSSSEPLFVVDGVPLAVGGGISSGRNPLNFINPDDIANITVLKDAASTAIYGSRGANGIILIETKSGLTRGPSFTYTSSLSTSRVTRNPDLLTAEQFRAAVAARAPEKTAMLGNASTDWRGAVQRDGMGQEHALAIAGAGDAMNYRLSLGWLDQEGVIRGSATERVSAALNYNHRLFNDRLNLRAHVRGARTNDEFTPLGVLGAATAFAPTQPLRTESGFFEWSLFPLAPNNPLAELALVREEGTTYRSVGNLEARYRMPFLEQLSGTVRLGYDVGKAERTGFFPSNVQAQVESSPRGLVTRSNPTEVGTVLDAYLNYVSRLDALDSDIDATAGYSYETFQGDSAYFQARGLTSDLLGPNGIPTAAEQVSRINVRESRLASFFGRVNYTLRDRYLLTLSVRRDGSSRFGPENQWGTFPAAAAAWRVSDEPFMDGVGWLSDLKLRASWGVNGNQSFNDYQWISSYQFGDGLAQVQFGDDFYNTIRPSAVDPRIKWEETTSYNLGFDWGVLDNRLSGSVEYYFKDTEDLIFRVPVAAGTNLSNYVTTNIGQVQNRGVELSLNAVVMNGGDRGFSWTAGLNAAHNRGKLVRINSVGTGDEQILAGGISGGVGSNILVLQPGETPYSFFVYRHKRGADGKPIYADANNDGSINEADLYEDLNGDGVVNQGDRAPFESPAPDWILAHTSQMRFRSFDLSFTLSAQLGSYVYNNVASNLGHYAGLRASGAPINLHASVLETGFATPQYFSDVYVEDASFLRMDNLTLGFTLPRLRQVQQARVFGTVQNVFTATGYSGVDPAAGLNGIDNNIYPRSRTFTAGVSLGF